MKFTKLNEDSSWLWEIAGYRVLVDPWFSKSQVDLHPLFSTQFHLKEQPAIAEIPKVDFIFLSHPFTDHCNKETLLQLDATIPVICIETIQKKVQKWKHFHTFKSLKDAPFFVEKISENRLLDLVHHAYLISENGKSMCYAPHGCKQVDKSKKASVLMTTTTTYQLPFFLGGTVNLGLGKARELAAVLEANTILSTHDEAKIQKGLVAALSKRSFSNETDVLALKPQETFDL